MTTSVESEEDGAMSEDFEKMVDIVINHGMLCDVCMYLDPGCSGGVLGGPNGPIYPPCADDDSQSFVDENLLRKIYAEIMEEAE